MAQDADILETAPNWLSDDDLAWVRQRIPVVYVEAVPVRTDHLGRVEKVGLLLRPRPDGSLSRAIVGGRVLYGETIREALWRHLTKDLGPDADPLLPAEPSPFTVAEYFPTPGKTGFADPRQHAVSLVYVVPVTGECQPSQEALQFSWMTVEEATGPIVGADMAGGQDRLIRMAMASVGRLP